MKAVEPLSISSHPLGGGDEVVLSDGPSFGVVQLVLTFGAGAASCAVPGGVHLAFSVMERGAGDLDRSGLREQMDRLGTRISAEVTQSSVTLRVRVLEKHLPDAISLLTTMLYQSRDDARGFDALRNELDEEHDSLLDSPDGVASVALPAALWPDTAWGVPSFGTKAGRGEVSRKHLGRIRTRIFEAPLLIGLAAASPERFLHLATELQRTHRESFSSNGEEGFAPAPPPRLSGMSVCDFPAATQGCVFAIGSAPKVSDRSWPLAVMHNMMFSGGFSTPLVDNIRSRQGLSYTVGVQLLPSRNRSLALFSAHPESRNVHRTLQCLLDTWQHFRQTTPDEASFARARTMWLSRRLLALETVGGRLHAGLTARRNGLPVESVWERANELLAASVGDVAASSAHWGWHDGCHMLAVHRREDANAEALHGVRETDVLDPRRLIEG